MATTKRWIREYELIFSSPRENWSLTSVGVDNPLNIKFNIKNEPTKMGQSVMDLSIFGLKDSTISRLTQTGVRVFFKVGYKGQKLSTLFIGDIAQAVSSQQVGSNEVKMKCLSSRISSKPLMFTFPTEDSQIEYDRIRYMITKCNQLMPNLIIDHALIDMKYLFDDEISRSDAKAKKLGNKPLLSDATKGTLTTTRDCLTELTEYCKTFDIFPVIHKDTIRMVRTGGDVNRGTIIVVNLGKDMLVAPNKKMNNLDGALGSTNSEELWTMDLLLTPEIMPSSIVRSDYVRTDAGDVVKGLKDIKVSAFTHKGEYRGTAWHTSIEGTSKQNALQDSDIKSTAFEFLNGYSDPTESKKAQGYT